MSCQRFFYLANKLWHNRQHCTHLGLQEETCPITHERASIAYNWSKVIHCFFFKTDRVACFPNGPTNSCDAQGVKLLSSWDPTLRPIPTLVKRFRDAISTNCISDNSLYRFGCGTLEKQMFVLISVTKITSRVTKHLNLIKLSFVRIALFITRHR